MIQSLISLLLINEKIYDIPIFFLEEDVFSFNYHKGAMWVVEPGQGESQHRGWNAEHKYFHLMHQFLDS